MEERSLRVLNANTTFFSKISTTISKLLVPTKVGINGMLISLKRNNVLKSYEVLQEKGEALVKDKKEILTKKYEDTYALYLEAIDKYIMDSVYTRVKNNNASDFEKNALSKYYEITSLKENEYIEYKHRKQKYLLELDFEGIKLNGKGKLYNRYVPFYLSKVDVLYKAILKNYSVKLSDTISAKTISKDKLYNKVFKTLEEYVDEIMPIKIEFDKDKCKDVLEEYEELDKFEVGKLDEINYMEKNMLLLGISRKLFTHSLPLVVAEQCYIELLKRTRNLIVNAKSQDKRDETYELFVKLVEDYNVKLLSTKIYWERPQERTEYKEFWDKYKAIKDERQKEILFIKEDLKRLNRSTNDYMSIIKLHKERLVSMGAMRELKNSSKTMSGRYAKKCVKC
ncbi:MAG: hypothetical protein IJ223_02005 [Clostridia bacterium]|nr:hypothetical protein [Clostridia bacterium]